jgi:phenylacetate-coenzyme A ligase PaaK-like adenylate-forming protein
VVDRREALPQLEVHAELAEPGIDVGAVSAPLREQLEVRLQVRVEVLVGEPGSIPRQELGKAKRVFERTS